MVKEIISWCIFLSLVGSTAFAQVPSGVEKSTKTKEKTAFQTSSPWRPEIDVRSDISIVYGVNGNPSDRERRSAFLDRVKSWRDHGYQTDFMTGIAWGSYQDYFYGKWDGKMHLDQAQVAINSDTVWHGHGIPYIVPVQPYINYFKTAIVKNVIDAGITNLFFEEPEFWARSGYSSAFKSAWQTYYGFPWRPQDASAENTYLSSKLKYHLYYNAIKEVSSYAKAYGKSKGLTIKVYIATHSLVNYSSWQIVSPEASLASLPGIDGYIAQVWTGTSREPTYYNGLEKERVFENAFLEYGSMESMTAPTGRKLFFLTDPVEDRARTWADYKQNYQATFTAELLYPTVDNYEVMPWPERIYTHPYKLANSDEKVLIPRYYSTQMQVMINALNNMPLSNNHVSGSRGIGVLMSNSLMFQRFPTHNGYEDPQFSNFYGQTFPLLKLGVPVETVHMENLSYAATLKEIKVLVVSYANMKPLSAQIHQYLADWVKKGGILIYCGKDDDPYQSVMEWWNTKGNHFTAPSEHLFQLLEINPTSADQKFKVGKGAVYVIRKDPKEFVMEADGSKHFVDIVMQAYENDAKAGKLFFKNSFFLERGPYDIVSVLDESTNNDSFVVKGPVIDLFDPELPVLAKKTIIPGEQALLYNLSRIKNKKQPQVLASASRIYEEVIKSNNYSFVSKSPLNTTNSIRILLPQVPKGITLTDSRGEKLSDIKNSWDAVSHTYFLSFENDPDGTKVKINW